MRRLRKLGRRPSFEALQRRELLSGAGVNLYTYYEGTNDPLFTDVRRLMTSWTSPSNSPLSLTSTGYPLATATSNANLAYYPDGVYQVSYKGTAVVDFSGIGVLAAPMTKGADGVTRGLLNVAFANAPGAERKLTMTVETTSTTDPMSDLHIWMPGVATDGSKLYTDQFLQSLKPFDYVRFMDWNWTNNSTVTSWSQRSVVDSFGAGNISFEAMIELCNESGDSMWVTIPALANDDYVRNLAALIHQKLDPNLKVYIEYSNETWNGSFTQYNQTLAMANSDYRVSATNDMDKVAQESALQLKRISDIFHTEYGSSFTSVIPVFSGWTIYPGYLSQGLDTVARWYGNPTQYIKSTAIAPYATALGGSTSADVPKLISDLDTAIANNASSIAATAAVAASYGLPLDMYEGGVHVLYATAPALEAVLTDPLMYDVMRRYMDSWAANGGRSATFYTLDDPTWGLKPNTTWADSQRYDGVLASILPAGDANLDGVVNFADFQIVSANMGRDQLWWTQGDFNHDGKVDATDLAALLANFDMSSLTADQAAQMAVALKPSSVSTTTPVAFQVFAEKYVASLMSSSASGSSNYVANGVYNGGFGTGLLQLAGVSYPNGIGVSSSSTIVLPLGGTYTSFSAVIGVDDRAGSGTGQATFKLIGDGKVLYTSPVMKAGTALPINVDVKGVSSLSLVVTSPDGSNVSIPADWAQARLVDARSTSVSAPTLTWTVTKNGSSFASSSGQSFVLSPSGAGTYVVSVKAVDSTGASSTRSVTITVGTPTQQATASYSGSDVRSGVWKNRIGMEASAVAGDSGAYASSSTYISVSGATTQVYDRASSDPRALDKLQSALTTISPWSGYSIASAWLGSSFTIDVNLADGKAHEVTLYALDWDSSARAERIDVVDAATGQVLDSRSISSFNSGVYLTWTVSGHVQFRVVQTGGASAAISGVFVDPLSSGSATTGYYTGTDTKTQGSWQAVYGGQGYIMANAPSSVPSYATVKLSGQGTYLYSSSTSDVRALQTPDGSTRQSSVWWSLGTFTVDVNLTDGKAHEITLYLADYDRKSRSEVVTIIDADTGLVLDRRFMSSFGDGIYLSAKVSGHVIFSVGLAGGDNAVLSGVFFDSAGDSSSGGDTGGGDTGSGSGVSTSGVYDATDATTQGAWKGAYGAQGYVAAGSSSSLPAYATVRVTGAQTYNYSTSTNDVRALQTSDGSTRQSSVWYGNTFTVDVNLTDGLSHKVSLYLADYSRESRTELITLINADTGVVLDTRTIGSFGDGKYLTWTISGHVAFKFAMVGGPNAVLSGVFIDSADASTGGGSGGGTGSGGGDTGSGGNTSTTGVYVATDSTTQGAWKGAYGNQGYVEAGSSSSLPSYATVTVTGAQSYTYSTSTNDVRALQTSDGSTRQSSVWWTLRSFTVDVNLTDGLTHKVSLYLADYSRESRSELISLIDADTGAVLDSRLFSSFGDGMYATWEVSGHVTFKVDVVGGPNAVLSGVFIDSADASTGGGGSTNNGGGTGTGGSTSTTGAYVATDSKTQGSWKGVYGSKGYIEAGSSSSLPSYANLSMTGAQTYTYSSSTNDVRALQTPDGSTRQSSVWWSGRTFSMDLNLTDGQTHQVSLYLADYDQKSRVEQITLINADTGAVLDTRTISSFGNGVYVTWSVSGHVTFKVDMIGGDNAVVSGLFID
ncbi:NPCBM/NEW2 domain-containing protein [Paludisphaera rhizosphaerae]|uniref:NPCBM/NEW2 domain-containing protein n=1 Tax=Paludisphaera rhizosphaerae TaxID=2711216 RepID=UPI0013EBEA95|nr:NPCBM/NEW2 domain-containing protein [Paludisphaera rhizosphaerae]